jgi:hypothetical protein
MAKKATVPPPAPVAVVAVVAPVAPVAPVAATALASPRADAFRASLRRKEAVDVFGWRFYEDRPLMIRKLLEAVDLIAQVHSLIKGDPLNEPVEDTLAAADGLKYVWLLLAAARAALIRPIALEAEEYDLFSMATDLYDRTMKQYKIADAKLDMYLSCE